MDATDSPPRRPVAALWWATRFALALFLFVGALQVMAEGAEGLSVLRGDGALVHNAGSTLGLGWLGALLVLSGSPVAASAMALVKADTLTEIEGFTMLTGSRLGAAFVVLLVAVIYALKGGAGGRYKPVSTAMLTLCATILIYVPGALIGFALLRWSPLEDVSLRFPAGFGNLIDFVYGGLLDLVADLPSAVLFLGGLGILLLSFKLIDTVLPHLGEEDIESTRLEWLKRKWPMFGLGCLVALVTMSVSVALSVLVPLVVKGYVKREAILPYIMGANITTLGDTLLAAFLLHSPEAVRIVLAGIIGTAVVSVAILAFAYAPVRSAVWKFQRQMIRSRPRLAGFTAALFVVPIAIMGASAAIR
ncbi:MAG: hypothetical protein ACRDKB_02920 [Actinomycetota bacterium]